MRLRRFAVLAALLPAAAPAPVTLPVHVGGRAIRQGDGAIEFGWPGVYIEGRFRGTAVSVAFDTTTDHLRLLVDGIERRRFDHPAGRTDATITGLTPGEHVVRLEKLTESQSGGTRFLGFTVPAGEVALAPRPRARQIEFIGDSYTVGYGNLSPTKDCTQQQVHDRTDTQQAFGPLAARAFGADYRINAYSGHGMIRNYNGTSPASSLPFLYPRLKPDDPAHLAPADSGWNPQLIVVNLGTNDFSTPLNPGERWSDQQSFRAAYRTRYIAFVRDLAARQPQARFLLMGSDMFFDQVAAVAVALRPDLPGRVSTLRFAGLAYTGCHAHPSLADDRLVAGQVEHAVEHLGLGWRAEPGS